MALAACLATYNTRTSLSGAKVVTIATGIDGDVVAPPCYGNQRKVRSSASWELGPVADIHRRQGTGVARTSYRRLDGVLLTRARNANRRQWQTVQWAFAQMTSCTPRKSLPQLYQPDRACRRPCRYGLA